MGRRAASHPPGEISSPMWECRAEGLGGWVPTAAPAPSGCYSLSVRRSERAAWDAVTHYRIHRLDNGWLYIAPRLTFPSLHDLVDHYSGNAPTAPPANPAWGDPLRPAGMGGKRWWVVPHLPGCSRGWGAGGGTY